MRDYTRSQEYLLRAERVMPLGTQTVSKSRRFYPFGVSPYFVARAEGSHLWDVDGNEYVDFVSGLASINLGYNDPDVTRAVTEQLTAGVVFSLSHLLELEVAEKIIEMVPCAEKVRFGKNGSDVTSAAVRLARAHTGRDHVVVCGYHGWQDWYIGSTVFRRGVPEQTRSLTHTFEYNDIESLRQVLEKFPQQVAAVILEPMNATVPTHDFLRRVKELTHAFGALLIFDELITGFRFAKGGAQECFGVTPDLATFGKALANGYPVSALAGRADVMQLLEDVFFSLTSGGESLSLAAALATLRKLDAAPVISTMHRTGTRLKAGIQDLIDRHQVEDTLKICGHPTRTFIQFSEHGGFSEWQIKTLFMQEALARGILTVGAHNITYAHSDADIDRLLTAYGEILPFLKQTIDDGSLIDKLRCEPLKPFRLR